MKSTFVAQAAWLDKHGVHEAGPTLLQASLEALNKQGASFAEDLERAGWSSHRVTIRLGSRRYQQQ